MAQSIDVKRRALGKGLESLLPSIRTVAQPAAASGGAVGLQADGTLQMQPAHLPDEVKFGRPLEIALDAIVPNPMQTRKQFDQGKLEELSRSIAASGVVQPIVVKPLGGLRYQLITGERRWLASRLAGLATIPAIVRQVEDAQAMEMTIVENLQRTDLNPMEQARAFQRLGEQFNMTHDQMAARTGKDRASVTNFLRLLRLPEPVQEQVEAGVLTFGHARALLALEEPNAMLVASGRMIAQGMSVRQAENYVQGLLAPREGAGEKKKPTAVDPNVREAEDRLRRKLGLKVAIEDKRGKGRVIIEYGGLEDFDAILEALGGR